MKRTIWQFTAALALTFSSMAALAHEYVKERLLIEHPWARPSLAAHVPAAVYFDIVNKGEDGDRLIAAKAARAEHVELHVSETDDKGVVRMRPLKDGLAAPAGETVSMETGAYHVMLIGLDAKLMAGESFPLILTFDKAGDIEVEVKVEDRKPEAAAHLHH